MAEQLVQLRRGSRIITTNSELGTFRSCKALWDFEYRQLLRPKRTKRPLAVGKIVHEGLAAMYRRIAAAQVTIRAGGNVMILPSESELQDVAAKAMNEKLQAYLVELFQRMDAGEDSDELVEEARITEAEASGAVARYVARFAGDARRYQVVAIELPFSAPMLDAAGTKRPRHTQNGVWDLVLWDEQICDVILGEHKTSGIDARKAEDRLDMDPQTTGYVWTLGQALRDPTNTTFSRDHWLFGHKDRTELATGRIFYNVVRKAGPKIPKWTKKGIVSAADVDTLQTVYEDALRLQEEKGGMGVDKDGNPKQYDPTPRTDKQSERLSKLSRDESKYTARHETWHGTETQERWRQETQDEGKQVRLAIQGKLPLSRNPGHCNMPWSMRCGFRQICIEDSPEIRESDFRTVSDPHIEVVEAQEEAEGQV